MKSAQQALLINGIYNRANSISVWLGPDELNDDQCVFGCVGKHVERLRALHGDNLLENGLELELCKRPEYLEDYDENIWRGIARLYDRPYWNRVWGVTLNWPIC